MPAVSYNFYAGPLSTVTRTNLVRNPSLETNITYWTNIDALATVTRSITDGAYVGTASAKVVRTTNSSGIAKNVGVWAGLNTANMVPCLPSATYTFSAYVRKISGTDPIIFASMAYYTAAGAYISESSSSLVTVTSTTNWVRFTVTATTPATAAFINPLVRENVANGKLASTWQADAFLLEQSSTVGTYFDGTNAETWPDYTLLSKVWNGTDNASTSTATWRNEIPAIQNKDTSFVVQRGRQQVQDPFKAGTATVTGFDISQVSALNIGDTFIIRTATISGTPIVYDVFFGYIADISLNYGITSAADTWTIQAEDALAAAGRAVTSQSFAAGDSTGVAATKAAVGTGVTVSSPGVFGSKVSAQTFSNDNLLAVLNTIATTEQGRLSSSSGYGITFSSRNDQNSGGKICDFTDGTLSATNAQKYDAVTFRSRADSYYTQVITEPSGLAAQTSGTGTRTFSVATYDQTTGQADNLADYILGTLQVSQGVPSTISFLMESGNTANAMFITIFGVSSYYTTSVILRGTQYNCFVEGSTISATPQQTRCTLNLSSTGAAVSFILDNAALGVLDTSRLGF